jgi:hypothetical protein
VVGALTLVFIGMQAALMRGRGARRRLPHSVGAGTVPAVAAAGAGGTAPELPGDAS